MEAGPARPDAAARRLGGVDAARALAIVGMVAVHFRPPLSRMTGASGWWLGLPYGKASVLFALVAGVGVSLLARRHPFLVRPRLLYRTLWLFPVGLGLQALDHPVAVILQYYAVWFALAALFVTVSDRALLRTAVAWLAVGSLAYLWVRVNHPGWLLFGRGDSPGGVLMDIALTGYYPTATWMPVVLAGMWLGRRDLSSPQLWSWCVAGGAAAMAVALRGGLVAADVLDVDTTQGWWHLLSIDGHSQMPLSVVGATGLAVAVLGACLWLVATLPTASWPLVAMGQGALTLYAGHLLVWHAFGDLFPSSSVADTWTAVAWFFVVGLAGMSLWLSLFRRGPLEAIARAPWQYAFAPLIRMARGEAPDATVAEPTVTDGAGR